MKKAPFPRVLDSTIMAAFKSCEKKSQLEYFDHWKIISGSVHLVAGAAYAAGQEATREAYYRDHKSPEEALQLGMAALLQHYGAFECPADSPKSAERTAGALEYYYSHYRLGEDKAVPLVLPGGKLGIEFSFLEPLDISHPETGDPLLYSGRMDMMVELDGMKLGLDDKTTSQLGASWPRQWDLRCFSEFHELYTRNGWRNITEVTVNTEILQSDAKGNLSFTKPTDVVATKYEGPMVAIEGRRLSQMITPNHRVLINKRRGGTGVVFAEDLHKQDAKHSVPLAGRHTEDRLPDDFQRFVAAVQADGSLKTSKGEATSGSGHREHMPHRAIVFGFTKQRKIDRCRDLLQRLEVNYKESARGFYVSGFERVAELIDMTLDENKNFKPGYETLFGDAFLDELEHWDGWNNQYYTNSQINAEFVVSVAALNDRAASAACDDAHWTVVLSQDTERTVGSCRISEVKSSGFVYCVTVPAGFVFTRMRGNISISGNSQFTGYTWGAGRAGIKLDGFLVRGVSILKTKYDTLQAITYRPQWQIDRWYEQLLRDITRMKQAWETGYWGWNLDHACAEYGGCIFRGCCQMVDPTPLLAQQFERRAWDPVARTETVLGEQE